MQTIPVFARCAQYIAVLFPPQSSNALLFVIIPAASFLLHFHGADMATKVAS